ncbi:MAG: YCF48-related protein [Ignavibacteria bacterium]|jgi:photosystem II stability/assembly factor-like uncharacterized protein
MRGITLLIVTVLLFSSSVTNSQSQNWRLINPDWDDDLYGFAKEDFNDWPFVSTEWAATDNGVLLRTRDGWENFQPVQVGSEKINRVNWELNKDGTLSRIIAVGENGTVIISKDNGDTWETKNPGTSRNLNDVHIRYSETEKQFHAWTVGDVSTILYTSDGGDNWSYQTTEFLYDDFNSVVFNDSGSVGMIVGSNGIVYKTTNGGSEWDYQDAGTLTNFKDVTFGDSGGVAVAVGQGGEIYRSQDNGDSWSSTSSGTSKNLNSVVFSDSGFIAGGDDGTLIRGNKSGTNWQSIETGTTEDFNEVYSDSGGAIWAVGDNGTIATNSPALEDGPDSSSVRLVKGQKGVRIAWDSSGTAMEYHVGKQVQSDSSDISDYNKYDQLGSTMSTSIDDKNVDENSVVTYIIKSYDGKNYSKFTDPYSIHYGLHPPSDLTAEETDSGGVLLEWKRNSTINSLDKVYRKQPSTSETFEMLNEVPPDSGFYHDTDVEPGETYKYKVIAVNDSSSSASSSEVEITVDPMTNIKNIIIPSDFKLYQNYPNPFNPVTKINYQIKERAFVTIKVYNILGKVITELVKADKAPGYYEVKFDGSNFASGIYIYQMSAGEFTDTKKLILLK